MFDWKGYLTNVLRNIVSIASFIAAICATLDGYMVHCLLFILVYAIAATDEEWYYIPDDDSDSENK